VVILQVTLVVVLAFVAGFLYWAASYDHSTVQSELSAQQIVFPAANSAAIKALPASDAAAMTQYAGQTMSTGDQAQVYANNFIAVHLKEIGGGKTYSQVSAMSMADPKNTALAQEVQTLFRGDTLRSMLLQAYGFWTMGTYALYAAIGLTIAAVTVFLTLVYELVLAQKRAVAPAFNARIALRT
jgi:hypothetical protein